MGPNIVRHRNSRRVIYYTHRMIRSKQALHIDITVKERTCKMQDTRRHVLPHRRSRHRPTRTRTWPRARGRSCADLVRGGRLFCGNFGWLFVRGLISSGEAFVGGIGLPLLFSWVGLCHGPTLMFVGLKVIRFPGPTLDYYWAFP